MKSLGGEGALLPFPCRRLAEGGPPSDVPHPFPYQGSKRAIAGSILPCFPSDARRLIEPFCGAGAISIAAAAEGLASDFILNDLNQPLMALWDEILERPLSLCDAYERLWQEQHADRRGFFLQVRERFNATHEPCHLLYLLARIVKGSVRYSAEGRFNQSPDNRRAGMRPQTMRQNILAVSALLSGKAATSAVDFRQAVEDAGPHDLVYMDPPYQGTSFTRDHRYFDGLSYDAFVDALAAMNKRGVSYIISYDGVTGDKVHGKRLPPHLDLQHTLIHAGRSTQATLLGQNRQTMESLYLSAPLVARLQAESHPPSVPSRRQTELALAV